MPELRAPLATYTGWNLRHPQIGAPDRLMSLIGSTIPFPATEGERAAKGDPRRSSAELGKIVFDMKVDYAVNQIRQFLAQAPKTTLPQ